MTKEKVLKELKELQYGFLLSYERYEAPRG
jgi:hypothetical protein